MKTTYISAPDIQNVSRATVSIEKTWEGYQAFVTLDSNWGITSGPFVRSCTAAIGKAYKTPAGCYRAISAQYPDTEQ